jgi:hypothetical protein
MTEFAEDDTERVITGNIRPLKLDLNVTCLGDVIQLLDTCMFFGVPFHYKIFEFVEASPDYCLREMTLFEKRVRGEETPTINAPTHRYFIPNSVSTEYAYMIDTEEYRALKLLATFKLTNNWSAGDFLEHIIQNGSLVLVEYYAPRYSDMYSIRILKWAVEYGQIPIMAYLARQPSAKKTFTKELCRHAARNNQLPMLRYLREILKLEWDEDTVIDALHETRLQVLRYALENGCPIPQYNNSGIPFIMSMVLAMETVEALRMMAEIVKLPLDNPEYTLIAARNGHVDHLQYLHEKNAPWHPQAINTAARYKHVECVVFGVSVGAPYNPAIVETVNQPFTTESDWWIGAHIYQATH